MAWRWSTGSTATRTLQVSVSCDCYANPCCCTLQVTWQWQKFTNEARTDGLQLEHWSKCYKDSAGNIRPDYEGPYRWAKLDVKVPQLAFLLELSVLA